MWWAFIAVRFALTDGRLDIRVYNDPGGGVDITAQKAHTGAGMGK
jgi:hypothetical protein